MFGLPEIVPLVLLAVLYGMRVIDYWLFQHYGRNLMWDLPWMKWLSYDEIAISTKIPRFYLRRILIACILQGYVDFDLNEEVNSEDPLVSARYWDALHKPFGVTEMFLYRRSVRTRRKRRIRLRLTDHDAIAMPLPERA